MAAIKTVFIVSYIHSLNRAIYDEGSAVTLLGVKADNVADVQQALKIMADDSIVYVDLEPDMIEVSIHNAVYPYSDQPGPSPLIVMELARLLGWRVLTEEERRAYRYEQSLDNDLAAMYWSAGMLLKPTDQSKIKFLSATPVISGECRLVPVSLNV